MNTIKLNLDITTDESTQEQSAAPRRPDDLNKGQAAGHNTDASQCARNNASTCSRRQPNIKTPPDASASFINTVHTSNNI
jgi:hypothetical protein